jgi:hypothetical protein
VTTEFRLVLCEPAVASRVRRAVKAKGKHGAWQGPLNVLHDEWSKWYEHHCAAAPRRTVRQKRETSQVAA